MSTPFRVAIIGSGPSGFYAADALLKHAEFAFEVDMFDRLPTPFGLVRGGVAPDHQSIKNVTKLYDKIAANPAFRFFGNVRLGEDLTVGDLAEHYDAWIYAVGSAKDRKLGIPGEELAGSHSATELVGWYNGHPDFRDLNFDFSVERVAVVGVGNVAMDVTRILSQNPEELAKTDIGAHAVEALRGSNIREVVVLGRRGIAQAAFSPGEIKEIGELESADLVISKEDVAVDAASDADLAEVNTKKNVDYLTERAEAGEGSRSRKVRLRFLVSPVEVLGENGKVVGLRVEKNRLEASPKGAVAKGTGATEVLPVGMVLRSVGYHGVQVPGVPFDPKGGTIPNEQGRVLDGPGGSVLPKQYVVGWAKRGPSGLIGTNRGDSIATVQQVIADCTNTMPAAPAREQIVRRLTDKGVFLTDYADWRRLDAHEVAQGQAAGKIREKVTRISEMLEIIRSSRQS